MQGKTLSEKLGFTFAGDEVLGAAAGIVEADVDLWSVIEERDEALVEAVARWLESEAARVEGEAENDAVDWQEAVALRAGAKSLRATTGHLRRELLSPSPGEGRPEAPVEHTAPDCPACGPLCDCEEVDTLIGCQRLGVACGLDFDEEDATLHLRRDDHDPEPLEGGRTKRALCGTVVGWDTPGGSLFSAPRCARCFAVADAEGFTDEVVESEPEAADGE